MWRGLCIGPAASADPRAQPAATHALASPQSFEEVVALIKTRRDIALGLDIDRYMRPISYRPGAITFEPAPGAPANLAGRLVARLKEWTGQPWLVAAEGGGGAESAWEKEKREQRETRAQIEADPFVRQLLDAFPGAEIVGIRNIPAPVTAPVSDEMGEGDQDD